MRIAVACDHRGFDCKRRIIPPLKSGGHSVIDFGCEGTSACDYPDFAIPAARAVAKGEAEIGILIDSSGIGMSVCANKFAGIRAAVVHDEVIARVARDANHCNVLCMPSDLLSAEQMIKIVETFVATPFAQGRHTRRIEKILAIEQQIVQELLRLKAGTPI